MNVAALPKIVADPNVAGPFLKTTDPVFNPAPETVAVNVTLWPWLAGLAELVNTVVVLLMFTGTVELPVATVVPRVTFVAVKVTVPTVLFVSKNVLVPPTSVAFAGNVSPIKLEVISTRSLQLVARL